MFQSKHPAAQAHAAARAVSGAAVYVSDYPGVHDFDLLKKLVLADGTVLRARLPGRPTADCLFTDVLRDGKTALKVHALHREPCRSAFRFCCEVVRCNSMCIRPDPHTVLITFNCGDAMWRLCACTL